METPRREDLPAAEDAGATILVVDDEPELCRALSKLLGRNGYEVITAGNGEEALELLRRQEVDLVLSDLQMPRMGGVELLKAGRVISPGTEFVIITGHGTIEVAVDAIKRGAYDFVEKPFSTATTLKVVRKALEKQRLRAENRQLRRRLREIQGNSDIIGKSAVMRQTVETARQVANSSATVLLTGESGTGKEVFAGAIHAWSDRADRVMVRVSCAALPETLLEAELFGYEKGAFTGAVARRKGRFEAAHRGTLFLDEVGEMSPTTQVKLLRVLQENVIERLGGNEPIPVDVRIIAATNADLAAMVAAGRFREDLYYRLNVINLELPALRRRGEDVILLADHFLQKYNDKNRKNLQGFTPEAVEVMMRYAWPGNVRELENALERAVVLSKDELVGVSALPQSVVAGRQRFDAVTIPVGTTLRDAEMQLIEATLESSGGDKETAANILGIAARTIYRKLQ
ncbi:MAG: sigma-54-dependent Fis family transcriptional regulator [Krumholzibacteria bacterium]|nr:sigma-54-dependent Fis family transcriptional regulator [Candidatus Krumholzibacteria bacterium]